MSEVITFEKVSKAYRVGATTRSVRDLVGGLLRGGLRRRNETTHLWALREVNFSVKRGEALGIIGPNGAGKTTILKLISSITRPTAGCIRVQGRVAALIELGAGFHPDLTGRENIHLNGTILGLSRADIQACYDDIVAFAELERFMDMPVKHYSSGMYVRLGFAIAAHTNPDVLLVDEVLAVGDISFHAKCLNRIGELQRQGVSVILVSHNMHHIRRHCNRAFYVDQGHIEAIGDPKNVIHAYRQRAASKEIGLHPLEMPSSSTARMGSGRIRFKEIQFADASGHERDVFRADEPIRVKIRYEALEKLSNPIIELALRGGSAGGLLTRTDSSLLGVEFGEVEGEGEFELVIACLPLKRDIISFGLSIFSHDYRELYDWNPQAGIIEIESSDVSEGSLCLQVEWKHRKCDHRGFPGRK